MKWAPLFAALLLAAPAYANAPDVFGFGPRGAAMAGAQVADADGWAASFHNPAAILRQERVAVGIAYGAAWADLRLDGRDAGVTPPRGVDLGLAVPLRLGPVTFGLALGVHLPDQFIVRIQLTPIAEPRFVLLDNHLHHVVVHGALALRLLRWLTVAGGASLLADAAGNGIHFDIGVVAGDKVGRGALDLSLPLRIAPLLGLLVEPAPWLRLGGAYRGALDLGLRLDIVTAVDVAGAVTGTVAIALRALDFYTPEKLALGVAVDPRRWLTLSLEVDWLRWSQLRAVAPDLSVQVALGIAPGLLRTTLPQVRFDDVWVPRLGAEARRTLSPRVTGALRLGLAYFPTPVPPQRQLTSLADNDRLAVAVGGGLELGRLIPFLVEPLRFDLALQWQELVPRRTTKDSGFFPGAGFSSSGRLLHGTVSVEARF